MRYATGPLPQSADPTVAQLLDILAAKEEDLGLSEAQVFHEFPLYREDEQLVLCQILIASPNHGIFVIGTSNSTQPVQIDIACRAVSAAFAHVYARLFKNAKLKRGMKDLKVSAEAFLFAPDIPSSLKCDDSEVPVLRSATQVAHWVAGHRSGLAVKDFEEALSTVEGAKGLIRPKERVITDPKSRAASVSRLEEETNRFDLQQREGSITDLDGPQRIRGLAGSGKTVVLAMKAALLHLKYPEAKIAFTFHTKSLYQHVRRMITRFYRQYHDDDPNWERLQVLHAWGGREDRGIYSTACMAAGVRPMTFIDASRVPGRNPFDVVCSELLKSPVIAADYDYMIIDEAQDFPISFMRLCTRLVKQNRLVLAYDQLQNIFQTTVPEITEIFGPGVELDKDLVLKRCYRNPLEVLVCAHALGFGLYSGKVVQMLENEEHWEDLGYVVDSGKLESKKQTRIERPRENSPSTISDAYSDDDILRADVFQSAAEEVAYVGSSIKEAIEQQALKPDDILVIAADDRNAKTYLEMISAHLHESGIRTNNLQVDKFGVQDFVRDGCVTLTTIHKAKGNEAYMVFVVGVDALFYPPTLRSRNMVFTAMTRAKAWLRITGMGPAATAFKNELESARRNLPYLVFEYPSESDLFFMKRDLHETDQQRIARVMSELRREMPEEELKRLVQQELKLHGEKKDGDSTAAKRARSKQS